ncbi:MAG: tape measure protein, partial [Thiomonas sp.]
AYASFSGGRGVAEMAEQWQALSARLKLATTGQQEFERALVGTQAIAQRMGASLDSVATVYGKMQQATRGLGFEQSQALQLTESVSQALRISGASASESSAALLQFGQAMASGVLRGDEFNSVMENAPRLARALADGLGVSIGKLRQMAEAGQLTADVVSKALLSQSAVLKAEYAQ